jgi:hypothetical protein
VHLDFETRHELAQDVGALLMHVITFLLPHIACGPTPAAPRYLEKHRRAFMLTGSPTPAAPRYLEKHRRAFMLTGSPTPAAPYCSRPHAHTRLLREAQTFTIMLTDSPNSSRKQQQEAGESVESVPISPTLAAPRPRPHARGPHPSPSLPPGDRKREITHQVS